MSLYPCNLVLPSDLIFSTKSSKHLVQCWGVSEEERLVNYQDTKCLTKLISICIVQTTVDMLVLWGDKTSSRYRPLSMVFHLSPFVHYFRQHYGHSMWSSELSRPWFYVFKVLPNLSLYDPGCFMDYSKIFLSWIVVLLEV